MTVLQIVKAGLAKHDGLINATAGFGGGECHCDKRELSPDDCLRDTCQAAYCDEFHDWFPAKDGK